MFMWQPQHFKEIECPLEALYVLERHSLHLVLLLPGLPRLLLLARRGFDFTSSSRCDELVHSRHFRLEKLLEHYFKAEEIAPENWSPSEPSNVVAKEKKLALATAPKILAVQLKRFEVNMSGRRSRKIGDPVLFPTEGLDVGAFFDPASPVSAAGNGDGERESVLYDLVSVVEHHGGIGGGH